MALRLSRSRSRPSPRAPNSSYWDQRSQGRGYYDREAYGAPHYGRGRDHVDIRVHKRPRGYARRDRGYAPRSYNGPVYQSQEQVQQSVYDFATGGSGDINAYR